MPFSAEISPLHLLERQEVLATAISCKVLLERHVIDDYIDGIPPIGRVIDFNKEKIEAILTLTTSYSDSATENPISAGQVTLYNMSSDPMIKLGRAEYSGKESAVAVILEEEFHVLQPMEGMPTFAMQDPFHFSNIDGWQIIGGVQIYEREAERPGNLGYRTIFFRYKDSVKELVNNEGQLVEPFVSSPDTMKGVRLAQLPNGKIAMFTRPQGGEFDLGKICYRELNSLDDFTGETMSQPELTLDLFKEGEWGGPNEVHVLSNGKLGVLSHIARFAPKDPTDPNSPIVKHYYASTFCFDPATRQASHMKIIATADSFPNIEPKKDDLGGIIYSGGIRRLDYGSAMLYCGVQDRESAEVFLQEDPFLEYERE